MTNVAVEWSVRVLYGLMGSDDNAEVYRKHADDLIRFASALVGPSAAEDVLASAVVNALATAGWAEVTDKRAYLFRAVMNEAARTRRTTERRLRRELSSRCHRRLRAAQS